MWRAPADEADFQQYNRTTATWANPANYDLSGLAYDANGNIKALRRRSSTGALIDGLVYSYTAGTNKLNNVSDSGIVQHVREAISPQKRRSVSKSHRFVPLVQEQRV